MKEKLKKRVHMNSYKNKNKKHKKRMVLMEKTEERSKMITKNSKRATMWANNIQNDQTETR